MLFHRNFHRRRGKGSLRLLCCAFALSLALTGCGAAGETAADTLTPAPTETAAPEVLADGIRINGVDVSGMTLEDAETFFLDDDTTPNAGMITIVNGELSAQLDATSVKGESNLAEVFAEASAYDEENPAPEGGVDYTLEYTFDVTPLKDQITQIADELSIPAQDATAVYQADVEGKFVYTPSVDGQLVEADALFDAVQEYVNAADKEETLAAPVTEQPAEVSLDAIKERTQLVSTATSSFKKGSYSAANRVDNMEKAVNLIDGYVLNPGETFSFNDVLGPRYTSLGWKAAGAINDGKSVEEPGGGVCQVSSTAFNAVLMADLTIVERSPHSWPLSYLPAGQDATINTGAQDFKFRNDGDTPVIISAEIDRTEKNLTVSIYGEPLPNGTSIKLVSEKTGSISQPADEVIVDKTMAAGTSRVDRKGRSGSRYVTYKEYYDANGNLIERVEAYKSTYRAISSIIYKGPDLPASTATVDDIPSEDDIPEESAPVEEPAPAEETETPVETKPAVEPEPEAEIEVEIEEE